jgi:XRE family transcriptional regulator, regulator of sulfur utilization
MQNIHRQMGERIRRLRMEQGFSQEAFADASEIHRSHLGEIERGEVDLTLSTLLKLGCGLQMPVSSLLKGIGDEKAGRV